MKSAIDETQVILEVLTGNRNAYADIVRQYQSKIRGYCLMTLGNESLAEDAAQEIFIKAYQALPKFQGRSSFSTWIYRIAVNHCLDVIRKKSRRKTESWEKLVEDEGEKIEALFATSPDQEKSENSELLAKLLSTLTANSKTILILREIQGLSYQELADTLGCSLDAVKSRLKRARQEIEIKVRHFLRKEDV